MAARDRVPSASDDGPAGPPPTLRIVVHAARDLLPKDMNGMSDPFVRLHIDSVRVLGPLGAVPPPPPPPLWL